MEAWKIQALSERLELWKWYSPLPVELLGQLVAGHSSHRVEAFHHLMKKIVRMHSLLQFDKIQRINFEAFILLLPKWR